ncbi:MAG: HPr family phosphocarrier protein [bacterium]
MMQTFQYKVRDEDGLHARPAGLLVKCTQSCGSDVRISLGEKKMDAKKLFAIMSLCVQQNDTVTFHIEGKDEQSDCMKLKEFCQKNL